MRNHEALICESTRRHSLLFLMPAPCAATSGLSPSFAGWSIAITFRRSFCDRFGYAVCLAPQRARTLSLEGLPATWITMDVGLADADAGCPLGGCGRHAVACLLSGSGCSRGAVPEGAVVGGGLCCLAGGVVLTRCACPSAARSPLAPRTPTRWATE